MQPHDISLNISDIQSLSTRDALLAFFTHLGYNTDAHLLQTPAAMGFTSEALAHEIRSIERIADEDGELQVYLVELKHLTVAITQALARALKNRAGNFLLVLTSDYERLDFVLMEQVLPERAPSGIGIAQAYLRPRVLTVYRQQPTAVDLRVLRRFTFTEIDPLYQWDKLRSAYSVAEWSEPFFNNRALFSDYYLNERLPGLPEWQEDIRPAFQALQNLYGDVRQRYAGRPETDLRQALFEPEFQVLGWRFRQEKSPEDDTPLPDYMLITPDGTEVACLTYTWDRFLDGPDETRDTVTPLENPGQTAVGVLDQLDNKGWVVMTNGKLWRLYSARAHSRATNYYEIDLEETLASPEPGIAFRYFWLFFRAAAFTLTPPSSEPLSTEKPSVERQACFLDRILDASASYAKALGERLKSRVFEEVFPHFAEGLIQHWRKTAGKQEFSDDELGQVFQATLTFLYRLLFLLYAEARDLLPVREVRDYHDVSLQSMKENVAKKAGAIQDEAREKLTKEYRTDSTELYDALTHLFKTVDRGDATLNVPVYNGGLFITFEGILPQPGDEDSAELHNAVFLTQHKIPDRFLALGLDRLARDVDDKTFALAMIDYKSLGVRQLGSIYEGLLEFKVRIAAEKMAVIRGKKGDEVVPYRQAMKDSLKIKASGRGSARTEEALPKGAVYLTNDRRERKATGSYYTPDYIVKYIVQNTVGPALEAKCEATRPLIREAQQAYQRAVERQKAFQKQGMAGDNPEKVAHSYQHVVDALFDLRVLDPAMGSGHFLVEVVDFITDRLLTFLSAFPWNPVTAALRQTRQTILEEMQRQGVNVDPARLTDVHLLKRQVLKRCIYGVDLNPMAVELAKVSLWLDCFTLGAPLSFLDHHLKCGNSLIGARIEEVRAALDMAAEKDRLELPLLAGMMGSQFAGVMLATDLMRRVGELSDLTAAQVRESRNEFRRASDALAPYRRILDIYTSRWFGNPDTKLSSPALDFLRNPKNELWLTDPDEERSKLGKTERELTKTALNSAREQRFFHWEIEFPEVFFGPSKASDHDIITKEYPGFNAVIGNPPYVSAWEMTDKDVHIRQAIKNTISNTNVLGAHWDLYIPFILQAHRLAQLTGNYSFILPNPVAREKYAVELREYLLTNATLKCLVSFGEENVFDEVSRQTLVMVFQKQIPDKKHLVTIHDPIATITGKLSILRELPQILFVELPGSQIRHEVKINEFKLLEKIEHLSFKLGNLCYVNYGAQISSREKGGFGKAHLISAEPDRGRKPFFEGKDLDRYQISARNLYLDYRPEEMYGPRSPNLFESPKLIIRHISGEYDSLVVSLDKDSYYCDHGLILATFYSNISDTDLRDSFDGFEKLNTTEYKIEYLLAILASRLEGYYYRFRFATGSLQGSFSHVYPQHVRNFAIRRISFKTPSAHRELLAQQVKLLVNEGSQNSILKLVGSRLAANPEESDVIHDLLTFLANQMIEMNKQKQSEMKHFLGWLEGNLRIQADKKGNIGLDALTGKSRLRSYLGDYQKGESELSFDELQDILFKNRTRLGVSLNDPRFIARLREEYEKSLAILLPIKEKLRWTDELIDQIVYRLYGLTEEEIAVVEGRK